MQEIKHTLGYTNISTLFDELERLYYDLSDKPDNKPRNKLFSTPYSSLFAPIVEVFEKGTGYKYNLEFDNRKFDKVDLPDMDSKNIIVCYSGGKDSFSVIKYYQKLGYNVYAYHIKGLNKTFYDEWEVAEKMAAELNVPLYIDKVSYKGNHVWIEHPLKNMIMVTMALTWGIKNKISTKIACGTFRTAFLEDVAFEICAGDCIDMWKLYDDLVNNIIPGFQVYVPNENFQTAYEMILKEPKYLPMTISCLTPNRFRNLFRNRTMHNYNINLMPYRCGCCWKCATEYIWFCDHDVLDFNKQYYIHCLEVLLNTLEQEMGYRIHSIEYVWKSYFFYSTKKSKAYKELKDAFIQSRKIKTTN